MVRKCEDTQKDWNEALSLLLFACCDVPSETTGFSPFKLLYGQQVRGPLDILREQRVPSRKSVLVTRKASDKLFQIGDQVLVLAPVVIGKRTEKFQDRWQGPYTVIGKICPVTYIYMRCQTSARPQEQFTLRL